MEPRTRPALFLGLLSLLAAVSFGFAGTTERVSVSSSGEEANGTCEGRVSISADGRYVLFQSEATNLVPSDTNGVRDLFLHDRQTGETRRISVSSSGQQADDVSLMGHISADGRFVTYTSWATNLVPGDTNEHADVFVYEVSSGSTRRISVSASGEQADRDSAWPGISADGRFIVFQSSATNLVPEDVGGYNDIYRYDSVTGDLDWVSHDLPADAIGFCQFPTISADGRYVVFSLDVRDDTYSSSFLQLFRYDCVTRELRMLTTGIDGHPARGDCWNSMLSADGRYVVFESGAGNLWPGDVAQASDIFLVDCQSGAITRESIGRDGQGTGTSSYNPGITPDGRFIAFDSSATNLLWNSTNQKPSVFVRDRETGRTSIAGLTSDGGEGNWAGASAPAVSADGRFVAFLSPDSNFVPGDTNGTWDVFVRDRQRFADVPVRLWSYDWIEACTNAGVVTGYPGGNYRPGEALTRAQMAVYLARGLAGGDADVPTGPGVASFADVGADHWAYRYIEYVASPEVNVVQGYPGGNYHPDEAVNRGQMAVYVARALVTPSGDAGIPDYAHMLIEPPVWFTDVTTDNEWAWCYNHVIYCAVQGIAQGYPVPPGSTEGPRYVPEGVVTRDQMAVYLQRAFDLPM